MNKGFENSEIAQTQISGKFEGKKSLEAPHASGKVQIGELSITKQKSCGRWAGRG